ncbi:L,D-transpeptidase family protein [Methylovulum miyakonense]|uniref:L,D-transpeptidase family protein n=1 Tax=Methylovulum miyakonense TaxID=645578 RepID=UPI000373EBBB
MKTCKLFASTLLFCVAVGNTYATTYTLPPTPGDTVITQYHDDVALARAEQDETLLDFARRFLLGQTEIVRLNQDVDRWHVKKGEIVRLSNKRILPNTPHEGITLNISEYRMYYYPAGQPGVVMSFAHGVGRQDWKTPLGKTSVARKVKDPSWHPPESIRREHAANGDPLPEIVPPGPHNPLGAYALYLNLPGEYRIHGTDIDKIYGIGMQITHGCVRMYPEDIEELYKTVSVGTPVYLVKQPIKVGWLDNVLYIEAHPDLEGEEMTLDQRYAVALDLIQKANNNEIPDFDQTILNEALKKLDGDPVALYERLPPLEEVTPSAPDSIVAPLPVQLPATKPAAAKFLPAKGKPTAAAKPAVAKLGKTAKIAKTKPVTAKLAKGKATATKAVIAKQAKTKTTAAKTPAVKQAKTKTAVKPANVKQAQNRKGSPGGYYHGS